MYDTHGKDSQNKRQIVFTYKYDERFNVLAIYSTMLVCMTVRIIHIYQDAESD